MNVNQILAMDRKLTDEEFEVLERETLKSVRELSRLIDDLLPEIAAKDPKLADRLELSSNTMLLAMESAADIPGRGERDEAALRDLAGSVRRPNRWSRRHRH